ncbi:MAG: hypothetical protein V1827_04400 [Candidatus Micrarchaeota archaeon]
MPELRVSKGQSFTAKVEFLSVEEANRRIANCVEKDRSGRVVGITILANLAEIERGRMKYLVVRVPRFAVEALARNLDAQKPADRQRLVENWLKENIAAMLREHDKNPRQASFPYALIPIPAPPKTSLATPSRAEPVRPPLARRPVTTLRDEGLTPRRPYRPIAPPIARSPASDLVSTTMRYPPRFIGGSGKMDSPMVTQVPVPSSKSGAVLRRYPFAINIGEAKTRAVAQLMFKTVMGAKTTVDGDELASAIAKTFVAGITARGRSGSGGFGFSLTSEDHKRIMNGIRNMLIKMCDPQYQKTYTPKVAEYIRWGQPK